MRRRIDIKKGTARSKVHHNVMMLMRRRDSEKEVMIEY